jgi:hypothetical protein
MLRKRSVTFDPIEIATVALIEVDSLIDDSSL